MSNEKKKQKEFVDDFAIGDKFNHNGFTYTKVSPVFAETLRPVGQELKPVKRYFDAFTKVQTVQE